MNFLYILITIGYILAILGFPMFLVGLIMLIVKAIRRKTKKPALVVMLLSVIFIVGGFALNTIDVDRLAEKEIEKAAKERVEQIIKTEHTFAKITYDEVSVKNNSYSFSGSFKVSNTNGTYMGFFDIVLIFDGYTSDGSISFYHAKEEITPAANLDLFG